jgi:triphosphoribosyl-dephospho-CoA synthetase
MLEEGMLTDKSMDENSEQVAENKIDMSVSEENNLSEIDVIDENIELLENSEEDDLLKSATFSNLDNQQLLSTLKEIVEKEDIAKIRNQVETIKSIFYKNHRTQVEEEKEKFVKDGGKVEEFVPVEDANEVIFKELYAIYKDKRFQYNKSVEEQKSKNLKLKKQIIEDINELINKEESINKTFNDFRALQNSWKEIGHVPQNEVKALWETYNLQIEKFYDYIKINKELRDLDLKKNFEHKLELCEKVEDLLIEKNIKKAIDRLQEYHLQWKEIGPVAPEKKDEIWERFKAATLQINKKHQDFFNNIKIEQDANLTTKIALCERVEQISEKNITSVKEWDSELKQVLEVQDLWKKVGFAPKKFNNDIYKRFREACNLFFEKKKEHFKVINDELGANLQKKIEICMIAESLKDSQDWKETTYELIKLQKQWKTIGQVQQKKSNQVWNRFRSACDYFFKQKDEYYKSFDKIQEENLVKKLELIAEIEKFKLPKDQKEALDALKKFQKDWSEIGFIPNEKRTEIQAKFRDAINKHFKNLNIDESKKDIILYQQKIEDLKSSKSSNKLDGEREDLAQKIKLLESDIALLENNIGFFSNSKNSESLISEFRTKIVTYKTNLEQLKKKLRMIDSSMR